ncbi:MAG: GGDEF domain-containing protein, partial [Rhizobiales bacterium]|nr:GGDEF domain-containing protein [Hyphomicrobiales bacterium]
ARLVASTSIKTPKRALALSVSYGVAGGSGDGSVSAIISTADRRMYKMKHSGSRAAPD